MKKITNASFWLRLATFYFLLGFLFSGCASVKESSKYEFSEGIYRIKWTGGAAQRVFVDLEEDTVIIVPMVRLAKGYRLDTLSSTVLVIPQELEVPPQKAYTFSKPSFDVDVLTIPFRYRPGTAGIPNQLITSFQGAVYLGVRNDLFHIHYKKTPIQDYRRSFNHFGYSFGFFSGIGASTINEHVTGGQIAYEYEGVVSLNGIAGIMSINNYMLGLTLGIDHLLDRNRQEWIYQHTPWVGLAFGLNLN